jgi:hypothetical protein
MKDVGLFYCHLVYFVTNSYILWQFDIFYGNLVYLLAFGIFYWHFVVIWYIFPVLVRCTKKNLATLVQIAMSGVFLDLGSLEVVGGQAVDKPSAAAGEGASGNLIFSNLN